MDKVDFPLNLVYLKYFCDTIKCGSLSAAARMNYVTQPAVTQAIAKLEEALCKQLFKRQHKSLKPTLEGELLYERGLGIFQAIRQVEEELENRDKSSTGRVDVACTHSFALSIFPVVLNKFKKAWPQIHVNVHLGGAEFIKNHVKIFLTWFEENTLQAEWRQDSLPRHIPSQEEEMSECV